RCVYAGALLRSFQSSGRPTPPARTGFDKGESFLGAPHGLEDIRPLKVFFVERWPLRRDLVVVSRRPPFHCLVRSQATDEIKVETGLDRARNGRKRLEDGVVG